MDDSLKGFSSASSSVPVKPSANPRISNTESKEADENEQKFPKNQIHKKPPHFMSPTISAISKKKILTERNESLDSSETHQLNASNLVPEASPINLLNSSSRTFSQKTASEVRFHKSADDEHNDSASKPYDPLTNYLSPRPKFLRYKPTNRRDMLTRRETETEKEVEGSDGWSSSERSSSPKSSGEIDNDAVNKDDDHSLEDDDEEIQEFEKEGGLSWRGVFKFLLVAAVLSLLTWYISCMNSSEPSPAINLVRRSTDGYINGYNRMYDTFDVNNNGQDSVQNIDVTEECSVGESEEAENIFDQYFRVGMDGHEQARGIEITESAEKHQPFQEEQLPTLISDSVDTYVSENHDYHEMEAVLEVGGDHEKGIEIAAVEDKSESFEEYHTLPTSDLGDKYVSENEKTEGEIETTEGSSVEGEDNLEEKSLVESLSTKYSKNNLIYGAFIALFMIIASSILAFYLKYKKATLVQKSQLTKKKQAGFIRSNYPFAPNLEKAHIKKVESYACPSPYFSSVEENSNDFPVTHAPEVELLGEFVVGDVSSSMKNCNMTSKTKELEVKFSEMEFQGETSAIFQNKMVYSRSHLSTPEFSASTATDSPSYGSVTDKKKRVKKEEESATTTPVRRSSRLRNRVMSP